MLFQATKFGGKREWEGCKKAYLNPPTPRIQLSAAAGLCSTRNDDLIEETLNFIKTEVQSQASTYILTQCAGVLSCLQDLFRFFYILGRNVKSGRVGSASTLPVVQIIICIYSILEIIFLLERQL